MLWLTRFIRPQYLAADAITIVKSIFQIFEDDPIDFVLPIISGYLEDKADRHKQRAAGELLGGMVRGSKHWPLQKQKRIWEWLTPKLKGIFEGITPETQVAWEMCVEYILSSRDPRRNQPLVDYLTSLTIDPDSSEAFNTSKQQDLVGTVMKSLGWHFTPWASDYTKMYSQHLTHPYQEVRGAVADNLRTLTELRLHPSYPSVQAFLRDCETRDEGQLGMLGSDETYGENVEEFGRKLAEWRAVRQPAAQGTQVYDKAALTSMYFCGKATLDDADRVSLQSCPGSRRVSPNSAPILLSPLSPSFCPNSSVCKKCSTMM